MRTYMVKQGSLVDDGDLDRGDILVWTESEWKERYERLVIEVMRYWPLGLIPVLIVAISISLVIGYLLPPWTPPGISFIIMISMPLIVFLAFMANVLIYKWQLIKGHVPALYEIGLQQTPNGFIPYDEISQVGREESTFLGKRAELVVMHPRFERKGRLGLTVNRPWTVRVDFLGEEGVHELERRVDQKPSEEKLPPVRIYDS